MSSLVALLLTTIPSIASAQDNSPSALQLQMTSFHQRISAIGVRATQSEAPDVLGMEHQLFDLQRQMHGISEAAGHANLDYLSRTSRSSKALEVITEEGDLLDAEVDAISNFLDTQDARFSSLVPDLERLIDRIEPSSV